MGMKGITPVTTGKGSFVAVVVPDGIISIGLKQYAMYSGVFALAYNISPNQYKDDEIPLPPGSYKFLATTKEISEEQAGLICDEGEWNGKYYRYAPPGALRPAAMSAVYICNTKIESLQSLLRSHELNPELNYAILESLKTEDNG